MWALYAPLSPGDSQCFSFYMTGYMALDFRLFSLKCDMGASLESCVGGSDWMVSMSTSVRVNIIGVGFPLTIEN